MNFFDLDSKILELSEKAMEQCKTQFQEIERIQEYNQNKMLKAFQTCGVSESHFADSTGYGYSDRGREVLDEVYATAFGAEDAIVRQSFQSGTHALTVALFGMLRPGDTMLSVVGIPYDTIRSVIGIEGNYSGSLKDFDIHYDEVPLKDNEVDYDALVEKLKSKPKMAYIQRSRGYSLRRALTIADIKKIAEIVKRESPETIVMVDNCYGELVETKEPGDIGADIVVGSLMKNLGGGIAPTGGYVAGKKDLIYEVAQRLTAPGIGKDLGANFNLNNAFFKGVFMAPNAVKNALKTAIFTSYMLEKLGYEHVSPRYNEKRTDLIQTLDLHSKEKLVNFTQGIQSSSPIDSFVRVLPAPMPGYPFDEVMASGSFIQGSTIELSADAPVKEPYTLYMQGGLSIEYGKLSILLALTQMKNK